MEMSDDIIFNIIKDWQKRDVSPYDKGKFILDYMVEKKLGLRETARMLGISHTTLGTWTSFAKNLKPGQYDELIQAGIPKEEIYKIARAKYNGLVDYPLDTILSRVLYIIEKNPRFIDSTKRRALEVIEALKTMIDVYDQGNKK